MAGRGGARPNSGPKKGYTRISAIKLREALEAGLGYPYEQMLNEVNLKLFNDFKNDKNVKEFIMFNENMNKRLLANPDNEEMVSAVASLSKEELEQRRANLLTRLALEANSVKESDNEKQD